MPKGGAVLANADDPREAAGVREGEILGGKYRVDRILGVGGMGVVVAAHHVHLDDKVALKFLLPHALNDNEAVGRFAREARAAVKIKSEYVARVYDVDTLDTGAPYMVMEFLEGADLATRLRYHGPLPVEETAELVIQACCGVAEAHGIGIIHRDLKPANLFCVRGADGGPAIKVLDFGISKAGALFASEGADAMTQTSAALGSPLYMSPEQMRGYKDIDVRTDVWALGVTLYELLTGRVPFEGQTIADVAVKAATLAPEPMRSLRADLPERLEPAVLKCLEKDRVDRYASVGELAQALVEFAPRRSKALVERISRIIHASGLSSPPMQVPSTRPPAPSVPSHPQAQQTLLAVTRTTEGWLSQPPRGRAVLASAGVLVVVVAGLIKLNATGNAPVHEAAAQALPARPEAAPSAQIAILAKHEDPQPAEATNPSTAASTVSWEDLPIVPSASASPSAPPSNSDSPSKTGAVTSSRAPATKPRSSRAAAGNPANALDLPLLH